MKSFRMTSSTLTLSKHWYRHLDEILLMWSLLALAITAITLAVTHIERGAGPQIERSIGIMLSILWFVTALTAANSANALRTNARRQLMHKAIVLIFGLICLFSSIYAVIFCFAM